MTFQYFVIQPDGAGAVHQSASREEFLFTDLETEVGAGGAARVSLNPGWMMAGYVNDCGHLYNLERNVVAGCLLGVLGAAQQPYAGPVVITGWDTRATYLGHLEVQSLTPAFVQTLTRIVADIRIVLGVDEGVLSYGDELWAADVRMFAAHIRDAATPTMRVVSGDEAVKSILATLRGRAAGTLSVECGRERHHDCRSPVCRCCHGGEEYVPVQGWLPAAQAREERRAYLDMDAAIERSYGDEEGV
jgi:hypothetical protein